MKESYGEGVAPHTGPESCAADRKVRGEALTGVRTGQPLSGETIQSGTPTLLSEAEGHTGDGVLRESFPGPAPPETLCTCGNSIHGNREIPQVPYPDGGYGRTGKATSLTPVMNACGKSDVCIVPERPSNNDREHLPAEMVEGRRTTGRTQKATWHCSLGGQNRPACSGEGISVIYRNGWLILRLPSIRRIACAAPESEVSKARRLLPGLISTAPYFQNTGNPIFLTNWKKDCEKDLYESGS
jgi:hypothetical protein